MKTTSEKIKALLFLLFLACIGIFFLKPIAQDPAYHLFADIRMIAAIPNFWNVLSNLPFPAIGIAGMLYVAFKTRNITLASLRLSYFIFFFGIFLTGIGSAYYHLQPDNSTLVWDRMPMTISFMSFFSVIIGEFISTKYARILLFPLLIIGISSVMYWNYTEALGCGDLRFYALVQFVPMVFVPLILLLFKPVSYPVRYLWLVLLAYIFAKLSETFDQQIFHALHILSGHSIKHLFAAMAPLIFLLGMRKIGN